jgi:hypothetical protein
LNATLRIEQAFSVPFAYDVVFSRDALDPASPTLVGALGLPSWHDALAIHAASGRLAVLAGLDELREHLGGALTVTLLRGIGEAVEVDEIDAALVEKSVAWMRARAAGS